MKLIRDNRFILYLLLVSIQLILSGYILGVTNKGKYYIVSG